MNKNEEILTWQRQKKIILKIYINFPIYKLSTLLNISYILLQKLNKILQEPDCYFVLFWNLKSLILLTLICFIIRCHSLSFFATCRHSLSLVVIPYHFLSWLSLVVPLFVICCTTHCHLLYHSLSLTFLFINDVNPF